MTNTFRKLIIPLGILGLFVILFALGPTLRTSAQAILTITPITWNVIGLDSNNVTVGPDTFPIGVRVCNTGSDPATNVTSSFVWDTTPSPTYINLRPGSLTSFTGSNAVASLAAGSCHDFYYEVQITRNSAAYDTTRRYHITASADAPLTVSTATPREIYVEHLISQNRNSVTDVKLDGVSVPAGGTMALLVGNTYTIQLVGSTATNGYEQIESYINFANTIFRVNSVATTYTADGGTDSSAATKPYADGCSWENDPNSPNYRSCLSTGKYGGDITVTYNVTIIGGAGTSQTLNTLIYDFSGSSYHYNADFSVTGRIAVIVDPTLITISKNFVPDPTNAGGTSTLTFTLSNPNGVAISGVNFTDTFPTTPGAMLTASPATSSTNGCGTPTLVAPIGSGLFSAGAASIAFSNGTIAANGTCTVSVTVSVPSVGTYDNTSSNLFIDSEDTGNSASDSLTVNDSPSPPPLVCGQTMAEWTVPDTATNPPDATGGIPTTKAADVTIALASAGIGLPITDIATNEGSNDTYSWHANGGFETGAFDPANNDYFQFQIDTSEYTQVGLTFYARRTNNGPKDLHVYYGTSGSPPGTLKTSFTGASGLPSQNTWKLFTLDFTGDTSTTGDTYFYIFGANSNNSNPGADLNIDLITFSGCSVPDPPTITKSFSPDPIAINGTSTLTFTLTNPNLVGLTGVTFSDALPTGLEVASSPSASTTCGGSPTWSPSAGDSTLTFGSPTGATIPASSSCTVQVDTTATTAGPHTNVSGFISSTEGGTNTGTDGSATDTLTALVAPVISKQFAPNPILVDETSTLSFTITNPNPNDQLTSVAFSDTYPAGVVNAASPSTSTTCGGTVTALVGVGSISFVGGTISDGGSCTVQVDVTSSTDGTYANTSGNVSAAIVGNGNTASDTLIVEPVRPSISILKQVSTSATGPWTTFVGVSAGVDIYYQFTVENTGDVVLSAVNITDPTLTGLGVDLSGCAWASMPLFDTQTCVAGPVTAVSGSNSNTATAHGAYSGTEYTDTSSATYATTGLTLVKSVAETYFLAAGDVLNYSYLVTNSGSAPLAGPVTISDDKSTDEACPDVDTVGDGDAFLDPGESITCTATYTVTASDVSAGSVTNTASATADSVTSNEDDETVSIATPAIQVVKEVSVDGGSNWVDANSTPGPPLPTGTDPQFRFTVTNTGNTSLSNLGLSDTDISTFYQSDLSTACSIPGSLSPSSSYTCYGTLTWAAGQHSNTATAVGDFGSTTYSDTDDANYFGASPPSISKNYSPDPITVGSVSTLTFTITNPNSGTSMTGVSFSDSFPTSPGSMVVAPTPNTSTNCGGTVTASAGAGSMSFSGGTIAASSTCSVTVDVTAPTAGTYNNTSGNVSSTNGGSGNTASDSLVVTAPTTIDVSLDKQVSDATPNVGSTVTFTLVIANAGPSTATNIDVTDVLPSGYTYVAASITGGDSRNDSNPSTTGLTWTINSLASGGSTNLTYQASVLASGAYDNYAQVMDHDQSDSDSTPGDGSTSEDDDDTQTVTPVQIIIPTNLNKELVDTNQVHTVNPKAAIGEILTYEISLNLSTGLLTGVRLEDLLNQGLAYVDCLSITAPAGLSTSIAGGFSQICDNPVVEPSPSGSTAPEDQGRHIIFDFGTLTNSSGSGVVLSMRYRVVVLNNSDNNRGDILNNFAIWYWNGGTLTDTATPVNIAEPELDITKTAFQTTLLPGENVQFTLTIDHTSVSDADAFDLIMSDVIPAGLSFVPGSLDCNLGAQDPNLCSFNSFTNTLSAQWTTSSGFTLSGGDAVISFEATLGNIPAGTGITNIGILEWSSLPGDVSSAQSIHNDQSTERFYDPPDPVNDYVAQSSVTIRTPMLPDTGFAPGRVTSLKQSAKGVEYQAYGDFVLEIPSLGVSIPIVGVPLKDGKWDLDWLWNRAGHLSGTAFPTWQGNTAITAHVYLPSGVPGPFFKLETLRWGDEIIIQAFGQRYTYEVREVRWVQPTDLSPIQHEDLDWVTLITCKGYDETTDTYRWRSIVRAVLMGVE